MTQKKTVKHACVCKNCGNEAEMDFECALPDGLDDDNQSCQEKKEFKKIKVKGIGVCTSCGNEADMWLDLDA